MRHEPRRRAAVSAAHRCPVPGCLTGCSPGHVVCRDHWRGIPNQDREPLRVAFRARQSDPITYLDAVALAARLADHYARRAA